MIFKILKAAGDLVTGSNPDAKGKSVQMKSFGKAAADIVALDECMREFGFNQQYQIMKAHDLKIAVWGENIAEICSSPRKFVQVMRDAAVTASESVMKTYDTFEVEKRQKAENLLKKVGGKSFVQEPSVVRTVSDLLKGNIINIAAAHDGSVVPDTCEGRVAKLKNAMNPVVK